MTILLFLSTLVISHWCSVASSTCTTPDGDQGICMGLNSCPYMADMVLSNPTHAVLQHVQKFSCEGTEKYNVCCGVKSIDSPAPFLSEEKECQLTAIPPEPDTECCGVDASGGPNRIVGGTETAVDEHPWLALIEYIKNKRIVTLCGGVLISGKYVLTAGHCIDGKGLDNATPIKVRLGEYDKRYSGPDCVEVEAGGEDCTDGAISVPIEGIIPYPMYKSTSQLRRHDIALIRLVRTVEFTDFIRPICLPSDDFTTESSENVVLYTAGWGAVNMTHFSSDIKQKVALPYVPYQDCQPSYNVSGRSVRLWKGQICAGGESGKDSCNGDSGGPLMKYNERSFELVGIVSFGPARCGMENVPGVYTKVFHYLPWIYRVINSYY